MYSLKIIFYPTFSKQNWLYLLIGIFLLDIITNMHQLAIRNEKIKYFLFDKLYIWFKLKKCNIVNPGTNCRLLREGILLRYQAYDSLHNNFSNICTYCIISLSDKSLLFSLFSCTSKYWFLYVSVNYSQLSKLKLIIVDVSVVFRCVVAGKGASVARLNWSRVGVRVVLQCLMSAMFRY